MKKNYSILTFLTGLFLVAGVMFVHVYDSASTSAATVASVSSPDSVASPIALAAESAATAESTSASTATAAATGSTGATGSASSATQTASAASATESYSATANYNTPEGVESISVTLGVTNGVVTSASIVNSGNERESVRYQNSFAAAYQSYVVGKSLSSLNLTRVAGASLTTDGFNSAVAKIRSEAA